MAGNSLVQWTGGLILSLSLFCSCSGYFLHGNDEKFTFEPRDEILEPIEDNLFTNLVKVLDTEKEARRLGRYPRLSLEPSLESQTRGPLQWNSRVVQERSEPFLQDVRDPIPLYGKDVGLSRQQAGLLARIFRNIEVHRNELVLNKRCIGHVQLCSKS